MKNTETKTARLIQEDIEDKIMNEILDEKNHEKRYQLIQQLDLLSRALITMKERDKK